MIGAPVDRHAEAAATALGRALAAQREAAAAVWARRLEVAVAVTAGPPPSVGPPSVVPALPLAAAGLELPDGRLARLDVDAHLLAGRLDRLAGGPGQPVGPVALSPAEEGLFAWLVLGWLALLPGVRLAWVHGGAPTWPLGAAPAGAVAWRITLDGVLGGARWWLPPDPAPPSAAADPTLPLRHRVLAGAVRLGGHLGPGDVLLPTGGFALACGPRRVPLTRAGRTLVVAATPDLEPPMPPPLETLPVRLDVVLGHLDLTVGALAALQPGQVLPVPVADPIVVTLCAGERPVAHGVLVDDAGRLAVQVTRTLSAEGLESAGVLAGA